MSTDAACCCLGRSGVSLKGPDTDRCCRKEKSLACIAGWKASVCVSVMIVTSHACFWYGQFSGQERDADWCWMGSHVRSCDAWHKPGGVIEGLVHVDVDYQAQGLVSAALGLVWNEVCGTTCPDGTAGSNITGNMATVCEALSCDYCTAIGPVETSQHCEAHWSSKLLHKSFMWSVNELWDPRGGVSNYQDMINGKLVAAVIVVWSLIWPHVKLLMLHIAYYAPLAWRRRERITYLLAFFGKWSFTDALTMIVVVALFNVNVNLPFPVLAHEIDNLCPALCVAEARRRARPSRA